MLCRRRTHVLLGRSQAQFVEAGRLARYGTHRNGILALDWLLVGLRLSLAPVGPHRL